MVDTHHKTYARLFREDLSDLLGLCRQCHEAAHLPKTCPSWEELLRRFKEL